MQVVLNFNASPTNDFGVLQAAKRFLETTNGGEREACGDALLACLDDAQEYDMRDNIAGRDELLQALQAFTFEYKFNIHVRVPLIAGMLLRANSFNLI